MKLAAILEFLFAIQNIWKNRFVTKQSKMKLYKVCVKSIPGGTRTDTTKTKNILRATEMKILRSIKGVTPQIKNKAIREELDIQI